MIDRAWDWIVRAGAIKPRHRRARRFAAFGVDTVICFPYVALFGERYIRLGQGSVIGPYSSLSAGVGPDQELDVDTVISIGDRCVIGRGTSIIGHNHVEIGNDVWTGPNVYVSDANHGYEDRDVPPGHQFAATRPVRIGDRVWLGAGVLVLPGVTIGRHVVIGAASVVTSDLPDFSVAVGNPARVVRRYVEGDGWVSVE